MKQLSAILSLTMLFLVGFMPTRGASGVFEKSDSLPLRRGVEITTDGQKQIHIYKNFKAADSLFRLSIASDSTYAPAYYYLSQSLMLSKGSMDSIATYAQRAYELDSTNKWYGETYAQILAMKGEFPKALELYKAAIEREPLNLNSYIMASMIYRQTSKPLEAIAILDSAEMRTGKNPYVSSMKRELLLATGQREEAIAEAVELTQIEPNEIENRMALAELYVMTKQDSLALAEFNAALAIDPASTPVLNALSQFHASRGDYVSYIITIKKIFANPAEALEGKIATFNRITSDRAFYARNLVQINDLAQTLYQEYPSSKEVIQLYAQHLINSGELDKALELYKKHTADTPAQYDYYTTIIDIESYKQRVDSVELYANRAIELFPDRHELRLSQANIYSYTKRYDEAIKKYHEILKIVPTDSLRGTIWGYIGDNYHQKSLLEKSGSSKAKSMMRKAYKSYDKSLEIYATNPLVLNNYAYFLSLEKRDLPEALDMSGRAMALSENNPTYIDTYAWILFELGRYEEAKKIMRQVIALDTSDSADIQFHYAEILAKLGEDFMAEVYYDKAAKLGYDPKVIEQRKANLK